MSFRIKLVNGLLRVFAAVVIYNTAHFVLFFSPIAQPDVTTRHDVLPASADFGAGPGHCPLTRMLCPGGFT